MGAASLLVNSQADSIVLSYREKQVVHLLCQGKTNQQIADTLGLKKDTIREYIKDLRRILDVDRHGLKEWGNRHSADLAIVASCYPIPPRQSGDEAVAEVPEWVSIRGVVYPGHEKAPFVKSGYGALGCLTYQPDEDLLQCHECGQFVPNLAWHARNEHEMSAGVYRVTHGLRRITPLVNHQISEMYRVARIRPTGGRDPAKAERRKPDRKRGRRGGPDLNSLKYELRNQRGTCHAQLVSRIKELMHDGQMPTWAELRKVGIHKKSVFYAFNVTSIEELGAKLNLVSPSANAEQVKNYLLEAIRDFYVQRGFLPRYSEFGMGALPARSVFKKHFGSVRASMVAAGFGLVLGRLGPGMYGPPPGVSGIRGVSFEKVRKKWRAKIRHHGKQVIIGSFDTKEEAILARYAAEKEIYETGHLPRKPMTSDCGVDQGQRAQG
jgi:DNA-binding CsgD family transcriptional regulator